MGFSAAAQPGESYPVRAVRMIVPTAAGGAADNVARIFSQKLSERWGQTFVVDPRAGANGNIGAELLAKADELRNKALEIQKKQNASGAAAAPKGRGGE